MSTQSAISTGETESISLYKEREPMISTLETMILVLPRLSISIVATTSAPVVGNQGSDYNLSKGLRSLEQRYHPSSGPSQQK